MKKDNKTFSLSVRQKAEELLKKKDPVLSYTKPEMYKLIHELEVHQIELEMMNETLELVNEELTQAKENAETAAQKYTELYDFAPSGYITLNKNGEIVKLNLNAAKLLSKERSLLIGSKFGFFVSTDTKPYFNNFIEQVFLSRSEERCEVTLTTNENSPLYVYITGIATENEEHCLVTMVDITEQKLAVDELIASEEKFRTITESSPDAIFIADREGNYVYVNNAVCNMLGYTFTELTKMKITDISVKEQIVNDLKLFQNIINEKHVFSEINLVRKDGMIIPTDLNAVLLPNGFIYGSCRDLTQRKKGENDLKIAHEKLEQLYIRQDDIKENERKAIAREIHDELGQLLTALKIDLGWTKEKADGNEAVKNRIDGMIALVNETIKSVQRISADIRPGLLDDLGLIPTIEWYCQEFELRTSIKCHFTPLDIRCTNYKKNLALYRILQEGLTNAIRHAKAKNVIINLNRIGDNLVLEIIDDGVGMHRSQIDSIKSLGVIGIKERVKQYKGIFEITSDFGKGTKLHVEIPYK